MAPIGGNFTQLWVTPTRLLVGNGFVHGRKELLRHPDERCHVRHCGGVNPGCGSSLCVDMERLKRGNCHVSVSALGMPSAASGMYLNVNVCV